MNCKFCDNKISAWDEKCPTCGAPISLYEAKPAQTKSTLEGPKGKYKSGHEEKVEEPEFTEEAKEDEKTRKLKLRITGISLLVTGIFLLSIVRIFIHDSSAYTFLGFILIFIGSIINNKASGKKTFWARLGQDK